METNTMQVQIDEINGKVDLILDYVNQQRLKSGAMDDLIADLSIIGKDVYDSAVEELDNQAVEIDPDELRSLGIRMIKNIGTFNSLLSTLESANDFIKDAGPIANEVIIDFTKRLHEFEVKGYFEFFGEFGNVLDKIVTHFSKEDVHLLADNVVTILETVKSLTQPEMMKAMNNGIKVYSSLEMEDIPEYSILKLLKEMRKPEMKRALGFVVTFLKNLSSQDQTN